MNNNSNVSLAMAAWLTYDSYDYSDNPFAISASTFNRSPRAIIGEIRRKYPDAFKPDIQDLPLTEFNINNDIDVQDFIPSRMGTAIHDAIEQVMCDPIKRNVAMKSLGYTEEQIANTVVNPTDEDFIKGCPNPIYVEKRSFKTFNVDGFEFVISGKFDLVMDGQLHDIKTTHPISYGLESASKKYSLQGSIYRWLNQDIVTNDEIIIDFLFTTYIKSYAENPSYENYPPSRACSKAFKLMSIEETEMFIKNKLRTLIKYWNEPLHLIPCCTSEMLYNKPVVYKYYKNGYKQGARATKNSSNKEELELLKRKNNGLGDIIEFKGDPFMCNYCIPAEVLSGGVEETISENHNEIIFK